MIPAFIVDDEEDSRIVLRELLGHFHQDIEIIGEASDVEQAWQGITQTYPRVVFLDIQMPGASGFDLLRKFEHIPFDVVFVTGHDKYALQAIKFSALDYLLKPIDTAELEKVVTKIRRNLDNRQNYQQQLDNALEQVGNLDLEKKIAVHQNDRVRLLPLPSILFMTGERNYTLIHTGQDERFTSSRNLGEFEEMLSSHNAFMRISKSCIINLNYVLSYTKGKDCMLTLTGGHTFDISVRKKQEFLERIKNRI